MPAEIEGAILAAVTFVVAYAALRWLSQAIVYVQPNAFLNRFALHIVMAEPKRRTRR